MIKVEKVKVMNMENAIRGMRNPLNSWDKSDSGICGGDRHIGCIHCSINESPEKAEELSKIDCDAGFGIKPCGKREFDGEFKIGFNDLALAKKLIKAGSDERKFLRQIFVSFDITAPRFWWTEMDTYKVSTVSNSTSTMHKLSSSPITKSDFSFSDVNEFYEAERLDDYISHVIHYCEYLRQKYNETKDKKYWGLLIELLPQSYNQMRTWTANYETLRNIYHARKNHKLQEWRDFCTFLETLPYANEFIVN